MHNLSNPKTIDNTNRSNQDRMVPRRSNPSKALRSLLVSKALRSLLVV